MVTRVNKKGYPLVEVTQVEKCIACNLCALICPDRAIEVHRFDKPVIHPDG